MLNKKYINLIIFTISLLSLTSCYTKEKSNTKVIKQNITYKTTTLASINKSKEKKQYDSKIIASFKTKLIDKAHSRIYNINKASKQINKYVLKPNEIFSFNKIVGKRTSDNGYKKAKVLIDGERDKAIGGGICQLSSTLYNAVLNLNLPIIERHTHSADIHYLPLGKDAAVDYNSLDLKFKNTKAYSLGFKVTIKSDYLYVYIMKVKHE